MTILRNTAYIVLIIIYQTTHITGYIFTDVKESDVIKFVENVMECRNVPGLNLAIVKGNETWTKGFGLADVTNRVNVTSDTLFSPGSIGKGLTMTLLGSLMQNKGYTWNTKLQEIEGLDLTFIDDEITREVTLGDLLAHKTGLSSVNDYGFIGGYPSEADREFLSKRTKYIPINSEFRNSFTYNNMMYMLLGYITELLGHDSWENLITSHIFEPIGMTSSKILMSSEDVQKENVAKPYIMPGDELEDGNYDIYKVTPLEPAGGVMSSANDMAKWMRFNLRNGTTHDGKQLIPNDLLQQAYQAHNVFRYNGSFISQTRPTYPVDDWTKAYGYAWFTSSYRGFRRLWHSGGLFSYVSLIWLYPDEQIGVFANLNGPGTVRTPGYALKTILSYVSDILLEQPPWLNHQTACSYPSPWVNGSNFPSPEPENYTNDMLDDFIGTYGNTLLPDVTISVKTRNMNDRYLWLEMNRIKGELILTSNINEFKFKMVEPWEYAVERVLGEGLVLMYPVYFSRSEKGSVESFNLSFSGKDVMSYRKDWRFMTIGDGTNDISMSRNIHSSFLCLIVMFVLTHVLIR